MVTGFLAMSCLTSRELHTQSPCCPWSPFLLEHAFLPHRAGGSACRASMEPGTTSKPGDQEPHRDGVK